MEALTFYIFVTIGVFLSSCSQILLKKSAQIAHSSKIADMLNKRVVFAYIIFFSSVAINIIALANGVKVKDLPILEALGYIFVPLLSLVFLREQFSRRNSIATIFIICGIIVFYF